MDNIAKELEHLYDEYRQQLFISAYVITKCADKAEDAIHKAFCKLLMLKSLPANLKSYMFKSVRNSAIDIQRGDMRFENVEDKDFIFDVSKNPREIAGQHEFQQKVAAALLNVSDREREIIVQHLYADLTFSEIAELLDMPIGTVTSHYQRGLEKLKKFLEV